MMSFFFQQDILHNEGQHDKEQENTGGGHVSGTRGNAQGVEAIKKDGSSENREASSEKGICICGE